MSDFDFTHSTLRERVIEHVFVGEVLKNLWCKGAVEVEVLRSEFDSHGYDVVLSHRDVVRHVQLKTQSGGKVAISEALGDKPSGCVIWITIKPETLELGPFRWFGNKPGEKLPDLSRYPHPKRATHNSKGVRPLRANHRQVPKSDFLRLEKIEDVVTHLFGKIPSE
jgi:hypothetical protein